jgi:glyoxylase-like metal-dependent hydrolase (beta-lactamase superfamily II)
MKLTWLRLVFVGLFVIGAVWATQQQDFSNVEIKATQVRGNIYMLEGRGGNIGVSVGEDGILIVDDQYAPLSEKIRAALTKLNNGPLKFVLNTHWHGDHTGGNPFFGKEAAIIAHTNVRQRLMTEQRRGERITPPLPKEGWPVITLESSLSIHFNGEEIKAVHFPRGHTDGDCVIFFVNANVVHMGDDFFVGRFPFVDLNSGGDVEGLTKNIEQIIAQLPADIKIIPGHGPISTLDDLKSYHRMLMETTKVVRQGIAVGTSLDELKKQGFAEEWKSWSSGFISTERWIETIHQNFSAKKN